MLAGLALDLTYADVVGAECGGDLFLRHRGFGPFHPERPFVLVGFSRRVHQRAADFPGDVSLEASDCLALRCALGHPLRDILLRAPIVLHPVEGDGVQGPVGLPVTSPVEPVPDDLAARRLYRQGAAKRGECRF